MKSKNCIIICNVGIESKSFNRAANRMESKTKTLGFEFNVFLDYKMMKLRTRSVENGTIFSAQEFILKNPSFNSVFFQKVNRLLVLKKELLNYISWFQKNKIDVYFLEENFKLFNNDYSISSEFQQYLN
jgi:hypothetical protein